MSNPTREEVERWWADEMDLPCDTEYQEVVRARQQQMRDSHLAALDVVEAAKKYVSKSPKAPPPLSANWAIYDAEVELINALRCYEQGTPPANAFDLDKSEHEDAIPPDTGGGKP